MPADCLTPTTGSIPRWFKELNERSPCQLMTSTRTDVYPPGVEFKFTRNCQPMVLPKYNLARNFAATRPGRVQGTPLR